MHFYRIKYTSSEPKLLALYREIKDLRCDWCDWLIDTLCSGISLRGVRELFGQSNIRRVLRWLKLIIKNTQFSDGMGTKFLVYYQRLALLGWEHYTLCGLCDNRSHKSVVLLFLRYLKGEPRRDAGRDNQDRTKEASPSKNEALSHHHLWRQMRGGREECVAWIDSTLKCQICQACQQQNTHLFAII